jgi:hypothetical protein
MTLQHFNYFWWDSEGRRIILSGTFGAFFFLVKCHVKEFNAVSRDTSVRCLHSEEKKEQVWRTSHGKGKQRSQVPHPEDVDSDDGGE